MEQSHVINLMVFTDIGAVSATPTYGTTVITSTANLADGELCLCNDENLALSAANVTAATMESRVALTGVKVVGRYGTKLVHSDMFKCSDIITYRVRATAAATEQVTHVGYTGSTGSIQVINDNMYKVKINFFEEGRTGQGVNDFVSVFYESDTSATGTEVVYGLEELLRLSFNKQAERPVYIRVLNSAGLDTALDIDHNITVVNGSKFIVSAADWSTDGAVEIAAVGDSIRIGSAAEADAAVALGSSVYKVVAIPATDTIELDRPVTGVSGTYTASTDVQLIKAATANAANFGLELHGIARSYLVGKRPYSKVRFTVGLENFGTTTTTYTTPMSLGHGLPEELWDLEYFTEGNSGYKYRGDYMYNPAYTSRILTGHTYDQWAITWASNSRTESIGGPGHNPKQLIIAADTLYLTTEPADAFFTVLDAYLINVGLPASGFNI